MDFFDIFHSPFSIPIIAIIGGCLVAVITFCAKQWRKARVAETEAALKMELVRQGRSADEIERIIKATAKAEAECPGEASG